MFDFQFALTTLFLAYAAFCPHEDLKSWGCEWCGNYSQTTGDRLEIQQILNDTASGIYGYVGKSEKNNTIVVGFRGSINLENWIENLDPETTSPFPELPDVRLHKGWWEGFKSISDPLFNAISSLTKQHPGSDILLTGHSLGAALSGIAGFNLSRSFPNHMVQILNYGMPRVGNKAFSHHFARQTNIRSAYRCVHFHDIVPHLPPQAAPFDMHHIAREVWWFQEAGDVQKAYKVCDASGEDPTCSDSVPVYRYSTQDHLLYLGVHNDNCKNQQKGGF